MQNQAAQIVKIYQKIGLPQDPITLTKKEVFYAGRNVGKQPELRKCPTNVRAGLPSTERLGRAEQANAQRKIISAILNKSAHAIQLIQRMIYIFSLIIYQAETAIPIACDVTCLTCVNKQNSPNVCISCPEVFTLNSGGVCSLNNTNKLIVQFYLNNQYFNSKIDSNWYLNNISITPELLLVNKNQCKNTNLIGLIGSKDELQARLTLQPHNSLYIKFLLINYISPFILKVYADNKLVYTYQNNQDVFPRDYRAASLCNLNNNDYSQYNRFIQFKFPHYGSNLTLRFDGEYNISNQLSSNYPDQSTFAFSVRNFMVVSYLCTICPDTPIESDVTSILIYSGLTILWMTICWIIVKMSNTIQQDERRPSKNNLMKIKKWIARYCGENSVKNGTSQRFRGKKLNKLIESSVLPSEIASKRTLNNKD